MDVHCHVGSLELLLLMFILLKIVHCHVGSLESKKLWIIVGAFGSLPRRQLRILPVVAQQVISSSLPRRQLRIVTKKVDEHL